MPSVGYQKNNDYSVQNFRPFEMPYASAIQAIATKTAYWQQGASKIKSQFDATVGLDPQYQSNKEYLKDFVGKAESQLGQVVKSDLADSDNVQAALGIFQPLTDTSNPINAGLMKDAEINKHYKEQLRASDAARTSDGGKNWSQDNDTYLKMGYSKYLNDAKAGNTNTIDENYQNKKSFIPYYDIAPEREKLLKECKDSSLETTQGDSNPAFLRTDSMEGVSAARVQGCLGLASDKYRAQIGIESVVNYSRNHEGLLTDFQNVIYGSKKDQLSALQAQLSAATVKKDKNNIDDLTSKINDLNGQITQGEEYYKRLTKNTTGQAYVDANFESLAAHVGFLKHSEMAGTFLSHSDIKHKLSVNAAFISQMNIASQENLQNQRLNFERDDHAANRESQYTIAKLSEKGKKGKKGDGSDDDEDAPDMKQSDVYIDGTQSNPEQVLFKAKTDAKTMADADLLSLKNNLEASTGQTFDQNKLINYINTYDKPGGSPDPTINSFLNKYFNSRQQSERLEQDYQARDKKANENIDKTTLYGTGIYENGKEIKLTQPEAFSLKKGQIIKGLKYKLDTYHTSGDMFSDGVNTKADTFIYTGADGKEQSVSAGNIYTNKDMKVSEGNRQTAFQGYTVANNNTFYKLNETAKSKKDNFYNIGMALGVLADNKNYDINPQVKNADGDAMVAVTDKNTGLPLSIDDLNKKILPNVVGSGAVAVNMKSGDKIVPVIKLPKMYDAIKDDGNTAEAIHLANHATNNMPQQSGNGIMNSNNPSLKLFMRKNTAGVPIKIDVINQGGRPIYVLYSPDRTGTFIRINTPVLTSEQEAILASEKIPAIPTT